MKKELAVSDSNEQFRWININATNDAIQEYARFRNIICYRPESFTLFVDARFDFDEVLAWVQAHGETAGADEPQEE